MSIGQRKAFIWKDVLSCPYCNGLIEVAERHRFRNSMILGASIGIYLKIVYDASYPVIITSTLIAIFTIQRVADIFYSLEPYEEEF